MDVVNVKDFGAIGDGMAADGDAIRAAAGAIPPQGAILYFPPGEYRIDPLARPREPYTVAVELKDRTWVLGSGRSSIIKAKGNLVVFLGEGVSQIRISNLSISIDIMDSAENNFTTALQFSPYSPGSGSDTPRGVSDIVVDSCSFEAVHVPQGHLTLHAVLAKAVNELRIIHNSISQMQIKLSAGSSDDVAQGFDVMGPAIITNNYITRPSNWGITAVHFGLPLGKDHPDSTGDLLDLLIADNIIEDPRGEGGIAVGTDGDSNITRSLRRVIVRGNVIRGVWINEGDPVTPGSPMQAIGVLVRAARFSEQILVDGNVISQDENNIQRFELIGIVVAAPNHPTTMKSLIIENNMIRETELYGIYVQGNQELSDFVLSGNVLENTGGIYLLRDVIRDGIIASNITNLRGALHLHVFRHRDDVGPILFGNILVRNNIFKNSTADGVRLEAGPATTISADLIGNKCYGNQIGMQEIGPADSFDTRYLDNDVRDNVTGGLSLVNPRAVVRNNQGWVTECKGEARILPGTRNVTVLHGLNVTPSAKDITITPTNNPTRNPRHIWVDNITETDSTVNCRRNPGPSGLSFGGM